MRSVGLWAGVLWLLSQGGSAWAADRACSISSQGPSLSARPTSEAIDASYEAFTNAIHVSLRTLGPVEKLNAELDSSPPCGLHAFKVDDREWVVSGSLRPERPRFIRRVDDSVSLLLVKGVGIAGAKTWMAKGRGESTPSDDAIYYLVFVDEASYYVYDMFQELPTDEQIAAAVQKALVSEEGPIAAYSPVGAAVTTFAGGERELYATILRPEDAKGDDDKIELLGPDGRYFTPTPDDGVVMRGSRQLCGVNYGLLQRRALFIQDSRPDSLELGCRLAHEENAISIFTRYAPDRADDDAVFGEMMSGWATDFPAARRVDSRLARIGEARHIGVLPDDYYAGFWAFRRGDTHVVLIARFHREATADIARTLRHLQANTVPEQR